MTEETKAEENGTKALPPGQRFLACSAGIVALLFPLLIVFIIWNAEHVRKIVSTNDLEAVRRELANNPLPPMIRSNGENLLNRAQSREMAELLIEKGENVNQNSGEDNETPLHHAAAYGRGEVLEVLVAHGADVQHQNSVGETPLIEAAEHGERETAALLLKHRALAGAADRMGRTPLHHAARKGDKELVLLLLESGADPAAKDRKGKRASEWAAEAGHGELSRLLEEKEGRGKKG
jgi:ankyrin repeat protein